jgi:hypothetical protein
VLPPTEGDVTCGLPPPIGETGINVLKEEGSGEVFKTVVVAGVKVG